MRALLLALAILLSGCAATILIDHKGPDAGTVVVGLGVRESSHYDLVALLFRKAEDLDIKPSKVGRFGYRYRGMFGGEKTDYRGEENDDRGVVIVATLPEGDYVLYNFDLFLNLGTFSRNFFSRTPVSIPFTVKAGTVAYLGNFQLTELTGKNFLRMPVASGGFFTIEDRSASERLIAEKKGAQPNANFVNFTPDVERIGHPLFITPQARSRAMKEAEPK